MTNCNCFAPGVSYPLPDFHILPKTIGQFWVNLVITFVGEGDRKSYIHSYFTLRGLNVLVNWCISFKISSLLFFWADYFLLAKWFISNKKSEIKVLPKLQIPWPRKGSCSMEWQNVRVFIMFLNLFLISICK